MPVDPSGDRLSSHVHQATGMVAAQANCDIDEALQLMVIRAKATDASLEDLALDVLDHRTTFYR
jgi:hypothetical protein